MPKGKPDSLKGKIIEKLKGKKGYGKLNYDDHDDEQELFNVKVNIGDDNDNDDDDNDDDYHKPQKKDYRIGDDEVDDEESDDNQE